MRKALLVVFGSWCCAAFAADSHPISRSPSPPVVMLDAGSLEGVRFGPAQNEVAFLGVPYAAAPVDELRWKPPQAVEPWQGTRKANHFGAACPQLPASWLPPVSWKEDCLYLNVWTAQLSRTASAPVLVYFHGGSNTAGYSQWPPLGPALSRLGVVVVSANYRLGPWGFLAHPALTAESSHHSSGNYGLLDQLQALQWVRRNISRFGGDPQQVTVMGQSAGAVDVCLLMASPLARGLFQRAIFESGECQSVLNEDIRTPLRYNSIDGTGESAGERLAHDLGVGDGPDALQKLRAIPATRILKTWSQDGRLHFGAIVDGWVVPEQPAKIFSEARQAHIPVLVGSNADEATVFPHSGAPKTVAQYRNYLRDDTGDYSDQEFQAYPVKSGAGVPARYLQLQDEMFAFGAYSLARAMTRVGEKAYLYRFTYAETGKRASLGAYHGEELNFLSNSFPTDWERSRDDDVLGDRMRRYWTQFAKTGNPNAADLPDWPAYSARSGQCLQIGRSITARPVAGRLDILERIMQQVVSKVVTKAPGNIRE